MQLIGTKTSPYVRKVRVAMMEKKLDFRLTLEDPWAAPDQVTPFNPLGQVPCLVLPEEGMTIFDSRVIVEYLDTLSPVGKLIPSSGGRERAQIKTWEAVADGVLDAGVAVRLEGVFAGRKEGERSQIWIDFQMNKMRAGVAFMEKNLASSEREYCVGKQLSLADIAVGCVLGWLDFRMSDFDWREHSPRLSILYDKLMQRPSFEQTVPGV